MGARINVAGMSRGRPMNISFNSGHPLKRMGLNKSSPDISLLMKWVTGQVRWQVTGRKPMPNFDTPLSPAFLASNHPRFSFPCSSVMSTSQAMVKERRVRPNFIQCAAYRAGML